MSFARFGLYFVEKAGELVGRTARILGARVRCRAFAVLDCGWFSNPDVGASCGISDCLWRLIAWTDCWSVV